MSTTRYPTIEEALAVHRILWTKDTTLAAQQWKQRFWKGWKNKTDDEQFSALRELIIELSRTENRDAPSMRPGKKYCYIPEEPAIIFGPTPSIISALHELGHHLYGSSELIACAFSLQLFQQVFPKDFTKLKPDGHTLKL